METPILQDKYFEVDLEFTLEELALPILPEPSPEWIAKCREITFGDDAKWLEAWLRSGGRVLLDSLPEVRAAHGPDAHLGAVRE